MKGQGEQHDLPALLHHPLRRRILRTLHSAGEARSPGQLGRAFRIPVADVSYHVRVLHEQNAVALTDRRRVRGGTEHFYVSTLAGNELAVNLLESNAGEDGSS